MGNKQTKEEEIEEVKRVPTKDLFYGCLIGQALGGNNYQINYINFKKRERCY